MTKINEKDHIQALHVATLEIEPLVNPSYDNRRAVAFAYTRKAIEAYLNATYTQHSRRADHESFI